MKSFQVKDVVACYVVQGVDAKPVGVLSIRVREEAKESNQWAWSVQVGGFRSQLREHVPDLAIGRAATEAEAHQQGRDAMRQILAELSSQLTSS